MAITKSAWPAGLGGLAAAAGGKGADLIKSIVALSVFGIPSLAAYAGYMQRNAENKIGADREFRERSEKAKIQRDAIKALEQQVVY